MAGFSFRFLIVSYEKSARKAIGMARAQTPFYPVKSLCTMFILGPMKSAFFCEKFADEFTGWHLFFTVFYEEIE